MLLLLLRFLRSRTPLQRAQSGSLHRTEHVVVASTPSLSEVLECPAWSVLQYILQSMHIHAHPVMERLTVYILQSMLHELSYV